MVVSEKDAETRDPRVSVVMTVYKDFRFFDARLGTASQQRRRRRQADGPEVVA